MERLGLHLFVFSIIKTSPKHPVNDCFEFWINYYVLSISRVDIFIYLDPLLSVVVDTLGCVRQCIRIMTLRNADGLKYVDTFIGQFLPLSCYCRQMTFISPSV